MSPTMLAILAALDGSGTMTVATVRNLVAPGTSEANMRVQIYRMRERHSEDVGIASDPAVRGGYRLERLSPRARLLVEAHRLGLNARRAA